MAALRPEERARLAAVREFELARLVGEGDIAEGLLRLRIAERRAYRRVPPLPPARAQQHGEESAAQQATGGSSHRRGRRGGASRRRAVDGNTLVDPSAQQQGNETGPAAVAPQPDQPQQQPQQHQQRPPGLLQTAPVPHESGAPPVPQAPAQIGVAAMTIEARDKRLLSPPKPAPTTVNSPPTSQPPAPKRQLLPPSSHPPSAPPSPPSASPLHPCSPPSTPPRSKPPTTTIFLPRPLAIRKLHSPPFTPTNPPSSPPTTVAQSKTATAAPHTPTRVRPRRLELGDSPSTGSPAPVPPPTPSDAKHAGGQINMGDAKQPKYKSSGEDWNPIVTKYYCFDCMSEDSEWLRKDPCLKPGHSNQETHTHPRICFHSNHDVYDCEACLSGHRNHCLTCRQAPVEPRPTYHSSSDSDSDRYCDFCSESECCDLSFLDD